VPQEYSQRNHQGSNSRLHITKAGKPTTLVVGVCQINDHPGTLDAQYATSLEKRVTGCVSGAVSFALNDLKSRIAELEQRAEAVPTEVPNENQVSS